MPVSATLRTQKLKQNTDFDCKQSIRRLQAARKDTDQGVKAKSIANFPKQ